MFESYEWIVIVGGFMAFFAAMGIGANDVANAFATSIGSKALTIKSAVIIAVICECAGAILMGSHVTDTIRKGIADYECFESNPPLLMMGCLCVLFSVGLWLFLASKFEMPVSTTHSCVGGMIGMTLAIGGGNCVNWYEPKDTFPFVGGVSGIVLSWFISPIFSAIVSMIIYGVTRAVVLRKENSFDKSFWTFPIFVGLTVTLNTFFIIYKGAKGLGLHKTELWVSLVIAFGSGLFIALVMIPLLPVIKKCILKGIETRKRKKEIELSDKKASIESPNINYSNNIKNVNSKSDLVTLEMETEESETSEPSEASKNEERRRRIKNKCIKCLDKSINYKVEYDMNKGDRVEEIHSNAEKFDTKTEESFKVLQIFTAVCDSFSHGANDVANSIGPFAAIYTIWTNGYIAEDSDMDSDAYWILGLGGIGIMFGLLVYGYKIIRAIGVKLCTITPSRGFSIELSSATIIIIGSRLGIPLSTTHCQVGATMGVAALEDTKKCSGMNCEVVLKTIFGWIATLAIVGGTTALLVAFTTYSPSVYDFYPSNSTTNLTNMTV